MSTCTHHWLINSTNFGVCKFCQEERQFPFLPFGRVLGADPENQRQARHQIVLKARNLLRRDESFDHMLAV